MKEVDFGMCLLGSKINGVHNHHGYGIKELDVVLEDGRFLTILPDGDKFKFLYGED